MADTPVVAELVMRAFHARTNAHVLHLQTTSFAQHKALERFYTELVELTDRLVETYQGSYGVIEHYPSSFSFAPDPLKLVEEFEDWIDQNRDDIGDDDDTHLQNLIDEIVALARSTRYQLRTLK
jgi:hypothetical protein